MSINYLTVFRAKNGYTIRTSDEDGTRESYVAREATELAKLIEDILTTEDEYEELEVEEEPAPPVKSIIKRRYTKKAK